MAKELPMAQNALKMNGLWYVIFVDIRGESRTDAVFGDLTPDALLLYKQMKD
jgi:hypothetical protein